MILHSRTNDVIPFANSEELAKNSGATLIEFGTEYRLADPEPLEAMLRACETKYCQRHKNDAIFKQWRMKCVTAFFGYCPNARLVTNQLQATIVAEMKKVVRGKSWEV